MPTPPPPLDAAGFAKATAAKLSSAADVEAWFVANTGGPFIAWFNATCAPTAPWAATSKIGTTAAVQQRFTQIWDNIPVLFAPQTSCSLAQFACLISIFINETGGSLASLSELFGNAGNPGISYLFNRIPGLKSSYNTSSANRSAFKLFNDPLFVATHGSLPQGAQLSNTQNAAWASDTYPAGPPLPNSKPIETLGFILQADFFKFRGRGFNQLTFRSNYRSVITWVRQGYTGTNSKVLAYRQKWQSAPDLDTIATTSTTADWDDLFQNSSFVVPCAAVYLHNKAGAFYLTLAPDFATAATGLGAGSIYNVGKRISGGDRYAQTFRARVLQLLGAAVVNAPSVPVVAPAAPSRGLIGPPSPESLAIRARVVAKATSIVGLCANPSNPATRAQYLDLIAPGEAAQMKKDLANASGCGLVVGGIWRDSQVRAAALDPVYRFGTAISRLVKIARSSGAYVIYTSQEHPSPGDMVLVGGGPDGNGPEHVYTVISTAAIDGELVIASVDGGQKDRKGQQLIVQKQRVWRNQADIPYDVAPPSKTSSVKGRKIQGWIDVSLLPFAPG